ncbi:MAG: SH3 domain-containing protein, partial [Vicinamibacterales bacterium]
LYRQQLVEVFEVRGDWARISKYYDATVEGVVARNLGKEVARWVAHEHLVRERPDELAQPQFDPSLMDSRIDGIPKVGQYGLSQIDVERLHKYSKKLLERGDCTAIDVGEKSVSRPNTYFVHCVGEARNRFFTSSDVD